MAQGKTRVLLASYGGGHVQSLIPVIQRLQQDDDVALSVIGFTTARAAFLRAGIPAAGYASLLDAADTPWLNLAAPHLERPLHPDVSEEDSLAYYAIGLRDLHLALGAEAAMAHFREEGRKAFLPIDSMQRALRRLQPDLIVTTTSPRSELALLRAGRREGIATLAVSDLFLQHEASYICAPEYADHLTVMARAVGDTLRRQGYPADQIHVTGNPAFDGLFDPSHGKAAQALRQQLGLGPADRLLMWACPSAAVSLIGKPFVPPAEMLALLEHYCAARPGTRYLVRQHPSKPVLPAGTILRHGALCPPGTAIETCLHACDQVILETSTVGLQAALLGKPVVTVGNGDYPPYAAYGLATDVPTLADAEAALAAMTPPDLQQLAYPTAGLAADRIHAVVRRCAGLH